MKEEIKDWNWSKGGSIGIVKSSKDLESLNEVVEKLLEKRCCFESDKLWQEQFDKLFAKLTRQGLTTGKIDFDGEMIIDMGTDDEDEAIYSYPKKIIKRFIETLLQQQHQKDIEKIEKTRQEAVEEERERIFHEIWDELDKVYEREMLIHKPMRKEDENIILGESYNAFRQLNKVIKALSSKEKK